MVALPTSQTRPFGAKLLNDQELGLISRSYSSFHNSPGPFGFSWQWDLPYLILSPLLNNAGGEKLANHSYRLVHPFGLNNVTFPVEQKEEGISYRIPKNQGIRSFKPNTSKNENRVEYRNGTVLMFNAKGNLIQKEFESQTYTYKYDDSYRLASIQMLIEGKPNHKITFSYDALNRVTHAETEKGLFIYQYNTQGDLAKITHGEKITEYSYNSKHQLITIQHNGEQISSVEYDDLGRVIQENNKHWGTMTTEIQQKGSHMVATKTLGEMTMPGTL